MGKDIQIKYFNEGSEWEELFPISKTTLVKDHTGKNVDELLNLKPNKTEIYTSLEIDTKLTNINDQIDSIKDFDIPVQSTEPSEGKLWFDVIE